MQGPAASFFWWHIGAVCLCGITLALDLEPVARFRPLTPSVRTTPGLLLFQNLAMRVSVQTCISLHLPTHTLGSIQTERYYGIRNSLRTLRETRSFLYWWILCAPIQQQQEPQRRKYT